MYAQSWSYDIFFSQSFKKQLMSLNNLQNNLRLVLSICS